MSAHLWQNIIENDVHGARRETSKENMSLLSFVASDFIDMLLRTKRIQSRERGVGVGEALRARDIIRTANLGDARFQDNNVRWVCRADELPSPEVSFSVAALMSDSTYTLGAPFMKKGKFFVNPRFFVLDRILSRLYVFSTEYSMSARYYIDFARYEPCSVTLFGPNNSTVEDPDGDATDDSDTEDEYSTTDPLLAQAASLLFEKKGQYRVPHASLDSSHQQENTRKYPWQAIGAEEQSLPGGRAAQWGFDIRGANGLRVLAYTASKKRAITWARAISAAIRKKPPRPVLSHSQQRIWKHTSMLLSSVENPPTLTSSSNSLKTSLANIPMGDSPALSNSLTSSFYGGGFTSLASTMHSNSLSSSQGPSPIAYSNPSTPQVNALPHAHTHALASDTGVSNTGAVQFTDEDSFAHHTQPHILDPVASPEESDPSTLNALSPIFSSTPVTIRQLLSIPHYLLRNLVSPTWSYEFATAIYNLQTMSQEASSLPERKPVFPKWGRPQPDAPSPTFIPLISPDILATTIPERLEERVLPPSVFATLYTPTLEAFSKNVSTFWRYLDLTTAHTDDTDTSPGPNDTDTAPASTASSRPISSEYTHGSGALPSSHLSPISHGLHTDPVTAASPSPLPPIPTSLSSYLAPVAMFSSPSPSTSVSHTPHMSPSHSPHLGAQQDTSTTPCASPNDGQENRGSTHDRNSMSTVTTPLTLNNGIASPIDSSSPSGSPSASPSRSRVQSSNTGCSTTVSHAPDHTSSHLLPLRLLVMNPELLESELGIFIPSHARYILERCSAFVPLIPEDEVEEPICDVCSTTGDLITALCVCGGIILHCNAPACSSDDRMCGACEGRSGGHGDHDPSSPTTIQSDMDRAIFAALATPVASKSTDHKATGTQVSEEANITEPRAAIPSSKFRRHTALLSKSSVAAYPPRTRTTGGDPNALHRSATRSSVFLSYLPNRTSSVLLPKPYTSADERKRAYTLMTTHRKLTMFPPTSTKQTKDTRRSTVSYVRNPLAGSGATGATRTTMPALEATAKDRKETVMTIDELGSPMNRDMVPSKQHPLAYYITRFPSLNFYMDIPDLAQHIEAFQHILYLYTNDTLQDNRSYHIPSNPFSVMRATCTLKIHTLFAYYHNTMISNALPSHAKGNDTLPELEDELAALLLPTAPVTMGDGEKLILSRKSFASTSSPDKADRHSSLSASVETNGVQCSSHNTSTPSELQISTAAYKEMLGRTTESTNMTNTTPTDISTSHSEYGVNGGTTTQQSSRLGSLASDVANTFPNADVSLFPGDLSTSPHGVSPHSPVNDTDNHSVPPTFNDNLDCNDNICNSAHAWCSPSVVVLTNWMEDLFLTCVHVLTTYGERRANVPATTSTPLDPSTPGKTSKSSRKYLSSHDWSSFLSLWHAQFEVQQGTIPTDTPVSNSDSTQAEPANSEIPGTSTADPNAPPQVQSQPQSAHNAYPARSKVHPLVQRVRNSLVGQLNQLFTRQLVHTTLNGRSPLSLPLQHSILPLMATYSTRALAQIHPAPDSSEVTHSCIADVQTVLGYLIQFNEALPYPLMNTLLDYAHTGRAMNPPSGFLAEDKINTETLECYGLSRALAWDVICQVLSTLEYSVREMRNLTRNIVFRALFATPLAPNLLSIFQWCHAEEDESFRSAIRDLSGVTTAQLWIDPKYQIDQSILHTATANFVDYEIPEGHRRYSHIPSKLSFTSNDWRGSLDNVKLPEYMNLLPPSLHRHIHMLVSTQLGIRPPPLSSDPYSTTLRVNVPGVDTPTQWPPVSLYADPYRSFSFPASTVPISGLFPLLHLLPCLTDPLELVQWLLLLVDALLLCINHAIGWIDIIQRRRQQLKLLMDKDETKHMPVMELRQCQDMVTFENTEKHSARPATSSSLNADELLGIFCWFLASSYLLHDTTDVSPVDSLPSLIHYVIALSPQDILLEKPGFLLTTLHAATQFIGTRAWKDALSCSRCEGLSLSDAHSEENAPTSTPKTNTPKRTSKPMKVSYKCYHCGMILCSACHVYLHGPNDVPDDPDTRNADTFSMYMRHHHVVPFNLDKSEQVDSVPIKKNEEEPDNPPDVTVPSVDAPTTPDTSVCDTKGTYTQHQSPPTSTRVRVVSFHTPAPKTDDTSPSPPSSTTAPCSTGTSTSSGTCSPIDIYDTPEKTDIESSSSVETPTVGKFPPHVKHGTFDTPIRRFIPSSPYVPLRQENSTFPHLSLDESTQLQTPSIVTPVRSRVRANTVYVDASVLMDQDTLSDSGTPSRRMSLDVRLLRNHRDARSTSFASPRDFT